VEPLRKRPAASSARVANRNGDLARIHIAKKALNQTEDEYRDLLQALTGKRSAGELSFEERSRVAAHMDKLARAAKPGAVKRSRPVLEGGQKKVFAMWKALEANGTLRKRGESSLRAFVRRMTERDDLSWCTNKDCTTLINALHAWGQRTGADVERHS
jgi:phage gp16-like protein